MRELHATMNVTLGGSCDHTQVVADDEFHDQMALIFKNASGLVFGRTTFDLLHGYWPEIAAGVGSPAQVRLARMLDTLPKYVVSSRPISGWNASRVEGGVLAVEALKREGDGTLLVVGSPSLAQALVQQDLIDEYHIAIHPIVAAHGPVFLSGLTSPRRSYLRRAVQLHSGVVLVSHALNPRLVQAPSRHTGTAPAT